MSVVTSRTGAALPGGAGPGPIHGRQFAEIGSLTTESGVVLPAVTMAYESWGRLNSRGDNAVLVLHALTGDAHVVGAAGPDQPTPGWWDGLIGPGAPLDDGTWFVLAANVLGGCRGSTGPSSPFDENPWGSRFPRISVRDQVAAEAALADQLGITSFAAVIGGSMGGMRAVEWGVSHPKRVARVVAIATSAAATADQIAWAAPQLAAIRADPDFMGGDYYGTGRAPLTGMAIARQIAHTTYRSRFELNTRFGRGAQDDEDPATGGRYAVESYLQYHGAKLGARFDPNSYLVLTEAMNSHDIGRGRGGITAALQRIRAEMTVAVVDSDRLYPPADGQVLAAAPTARPLITMHSNFGHDGFLIEAGQVAGVVRGALTG